MENIKADDDSYHLGHFLMDFFNNDNEDHVLQIDAGTGASELKSSVRARTVRLARSLRRAGAAPGHALVVSGGNHLDLYIPFYAAYMNGMPVAGINPDYKYDEIKIQIEMIKPKIVFCEVQNVGDYEKIFTELGLDAHAQLVTFGGGEQSLANFVKKFDDKVPLNEFRVATFDPRRVFAWLISTSGTTGQRKLAAFTHSEVLKSYRFYSRLMRTDKMALALHLCNVDWITTYLESLSMVTANHVKLQTSCAPTVDHVIDIINQYKPEFTSGMPVIFSQILAQDKLCDLTCFKKIVISGMPTSADTFLRLKARIHPDGVLLNNYGMTECLGPVLMPAPAGPVGNVGTEVLEIKLQLVDPNTQEVITKPNTVGELWTKGPRFTEYYNNPEATAAAFSPDGWYKTGDLLYRDEHGFYFFTERMSLCFKTDVFWVMPTELEAVIRQHRDVVDVCVVGVPHPARVRQAAACVQRAPASALQAGEVAQLVAANFSEFKHLHGGVVFVEALPRTASGKIARAKVAELVLRATTQHAEETTFRLDQLV